MANYRIGPADWLVDQDTGEVVGYRLRDGTVRPVMRYATLTAATVDLNTSPPLEFTAGTDAAAGEAWLEGCAWADRPTVDEIPDGANCWIRFSDLGVHGGGSVYNWNSTKGRWWPTQPTCLMLREDNVANPAPEVGVYQYLPASGTTLVSGAIPPGLLLSGSYFDIIGGIQKSGETSTVDVFRVALAKTRSTQTTFLGGWSTTLGAGDNDRCFHQRYRAVDATTLHRMGSGATTGGWIGAAYTAYTGPITLPGAADMDTDTLYLFAQMTQGVAGTDQALNPLQLIIYP